MQTFLPYSDFERTARVLDRKRLGKQRVEAYQILKALSDLDYGWQHHPAVLMWRGYEAALVSYYAAICREWVRRGYRHTMPVLIAGPYTAPPWMGDERIHTSHRSKLYQKDPHYYYGWTGIQPMAYRWPRCEKENGCDGTN